ncbi:MAG: MerR family transcriptional regulator [Sphingomonadaceae bacterium]|nr:MerR family transcriptional regulator [Sphingomonadaceae bacterium]
MTTLSITEVCRRTGLSARALRFYEARGLVAAQRTAAGQRRYGVREVARLHNVTALKRAGFSLAQIAALTGHAWLDLDRLLAAQIADLTARRGAIDAALTGLRAAERRLAAGEVLDLDTLCTLIKQGETTMTTEEQWQKVADRYFTPEEQARWRAKIADVPVGFDQAAYQAQWADLGSRIAADLPLDPASDKAQAYLAEWNDLLKPFNMAADARMKTMAVELYDRMDEWSNEASPGFGKPVWEFIKAAAVARG